MNKFRRLIFGIVSIALYILASSASSAPDRSGRGVSEQARHFSPLVFVGVVKTRSNNATTWSVEVPISGVPSLELTVPNAGPGAGNAMFSPGDRWLYSNDATMYKSVRLGTGDQARPSPCNKNSECSAGDACVATMQKTACGPNATCRLEICLPAR
jgi:hypothetical protein